MTAVLQRKLATTSILKPLHLTVYLRRNFSQRRPDSLRLCPQGETEFKIPTPNCYNNYIINYGTMNN